MAKKIRVLLVDRVSKTIESMRYILSHEKNIKVVGECVNGESALKKAKELRPDIVLLDINMSGIDDMSITEILTANIPDILVIVTFNGGERKNLKKAMADGAREYIVKPFSADTLIDTIINLYEKDSKRRMMLDNISGQNRIETKPKIVSIFSTKGGVGKSTIATNIAVSLTKKTNKEVVIIDLDLQFGDVSMMMNLYPERTIADLVNDIPNLDKDILDEYLTEHPSGVKVLSAPHSPEYAEFITSSCIEKILKILLESYEYIVIDTAPTFDDINLTVIDISDKVFFVTTLDLPTIKNVKLGLHIMDTLKYDENKVSLILNRYHRNFGISPTDLEKSTNKKILHILPEDKDTVIRSANAGKPLALEQNYSAISKGIMAISDFIIDRKEKKKTIFKKMLRG